LVEHHESDCCCQERGGDQGFFALPHARRMS
jgi:hypothetical protein